MFSWSGIVGGNLQGCAQKRLASRELYHPRNRCHLVARRERSLNAVNFSSLPSNQSLGYNSANLEEAYSMKWFPHDLALWGFILTVIGLLLGIPIGVASN